MTSFLFYNIRDNGGFYMTDYSQVCKVRDVFSNEDVWDITWDPSWAIITVKRTYGSVRLVMDIISDTGEIRDAHIEDAYIQFKDFNGWRSEGYSTIQDIIKIEKQMPRWQNKLYKAFKGSEED